MRNILPAAIILCTLSAAAIAHEAPPADFNDGVVVGKLAAEIHQLRDDVAAMRVELHEMHEQMTRLKNKPARSVADLPEKGDDR